MKLKDMAPKLLVIGACLSTLVISACAGTPTTTETTSNAPTSLSEELAATMVPDVNIHMYLFVKQASPTTVPKSLLDTPNDIAVESLSLWGVESGDEYTLGGALVFSSADDASLIVSKIAGQSKTWNKLAGRTIYLVQGTGAAADSLKAAIDGNHFKPYDDATALDEVARMPAGESTVPDAVLIVKPSRVMIDQIKKYDEQAPTDLLNTIVSWAKPQVITLGLYATKQIDIADLVQRVDNNTIWDGDLGLVASIKSAWPGFIVSPIAGKILDHTDYTKTTLGDLTVYDGSFNDSGTSVSLLLNVDGNRLWATASSQESYARTLMTDITR
jgi:hypothetical protein